MVRRALDVMLGSETIGGLPGSSLPRHIDLAESILYLCALIADQPRSIDRHIDYFGETRRDADHRRARREGAPPSVARAV